MATYTDLVTVLESFELTDILLPFVLFFTIIYAVLQKSKILGEDKKNFNVIVALVISLMMVIPHVVGRYPSQYDPINIINNALPSIAIVIVAIILFFVLIGLFGAKAPFGGSSFGGFVAIIAFLFVLIVFLNAAGLLGSGRIYNVPIIGPFLADPATQSLVVTILVFGLIVWFITREPKPVGQKMMGELGKNIKDFFWGNK